jgi:hypothetical protein
VNIWALEGIGIGVGGVLGALAIASGMKLADRQWLRDNPEPPPGRPGDDSQFATWPNVRIPSEPDQSGKDMQQ